MMALLNHVDSTYTLATYNPRYTFHVCSTLTECTEQTWITVLWFNVDSMDTLATYIQRTDNNVDSQLTKCSFWTDNLKHEIKVVSTLILCSFGTYTLQPRCNVDSTLLYVLCRRGLEVTVRIEVHVITEYAYPPGLHAYILSSAE